MIPEMFNGLPVQLPAKQIHKTPRLLMTDAYTFGSNHFESPEAKSKSVYYITFRKLLHNINPYLYKKGDDRIVFAGISKLIYYLFAERITMDEIETTDLFVSQAKVTSSGLTEYGYPREIWVEIVEKYNGRPPIEILSLPEGSICYPNEPVVQITSSALSSEQMGILGAWFESQQLLSWAPTEFITQNEHWLMIYKEMIAKYDTSLKENEVDFLARISLVDFGARSSITPQETEWLGEYYLYTFSGTDSFAGAYQAWENNGRINDGVFNTVNALAHRNVQTWETETDCYKALYASMKDNEIGSFVCDCYSSYDAVSGPLMELAVDAHNMSNGKVIVARIDSGNAIEQAIWICRLAHKHGLFTTKIINGREWRMATNLKFMISNDVQWIEMVKVWDKLVEESFMPYSWGLFGMGGFKRNEIARDNLSAKYALCAYGDDNIPACKFSEDIGKTTLPGPFKLLRDLTSLLDKKTIVFNYENGVDARVVYYNGANIYRPFGEVMDETFSMKKARISTQLKYMPLTMVSDTNMNFPISELIREKRRELLRINAPKKQVYNY